MKTQTSIISAIIIIALTIGVSAYAHGPGGNSSGDYGMGGSSYGMMGGNGMMGGSGMMGGNGMMGGYGSGQGMRRGYGHNGNGNSHDTWNPNRQPSQDYRQGGTSSTAEIESLRNQIQEKRRELSSLYRSGNTDKALMERKMAELNNLERYLDEKMAGMR